jgi:hypothetical protein
MAEAGIRANRHGTAKLAAELRCVVMDAILDARLAGFKTVCGLRNSKVTGLGLSRLLLVRPRFIYMSPGGMLMITTPCPQLEPAGCPVQGNGYVRSRSP